MNRRLFLSIGAAAALAAAGGYFYTDSRRSRLSAEIPSDPLALFLARSLPDLDGRDQPLVQWSGQVRVINFWATWCVPCVKEMPQLEALQQAFKDVCFVGIGVDTADNMRRFVQKIPVSYPLLVAGAEGVDVLRALGNTAGGLPFTLVLSADGSIKQKILGQIDVVALRQTLVRLIS